MNKKELISLAIVLLLGLFLGTAGCQSDNKTTGTSTPFMGGTNGILLSFTPEAPPAEVYDSGNYPFDIVIQLTNDGEYDVKAADATVRILGIDPADFGKTTAELSLQPVEDLLGSYKEADTGTVIKGTTTTVEFTNFNYKGKTAGNMQMPLFADICYTYGTKVASQLCIKKDPTDSSSRICVVEEDKPVYSSSAPVQVSLLHQSLRGRNTVGFTFTVQKKGNGNVFSRGSKCDTTGILYENKVWIEVIVPEMTGLKCTGFTGGTDNTGFVTLYSGERTISCTQPAPADTDYVKNIDINLVYDYREDITTNILIKHTPN
jgi:hypothetical protein